jgi:hypothetical protein
MNDQIAKHICASALRCSTSLGQILPFAKAYCSKEEYTTLLTAVATATSAINDEIVEPILQKHPELKTEVDNSMAQYGVLI